MLYFFILSCILVISKPLLKSVSSLDMQMMSLSWVLGKKFSVLISWFRKTRAFSSLFHGLTMKSDVKKAMRVENAKEKQFVCLLDLPDSVLECILERLPPAGLCSMAGVCRSLRESCTSDYLWEKHMKQKWASLVGPAAYRKWQCRTASLVRPAISDGKKRKGSFDYFQSVRPQRKSRSKVNDSSDKQISLAPGALMAWYLSLETGKFWFPAQVYNRENGHVGFMLSCYDAGVCYDFRTNTFRASFSNGGQTMEENIEWNRLRKPAVDTPADVLHISDCLNDLKPDDHIEIQWRRSKEFPYGWWYGVVGHLDTCEGDAVFCQCHMNGTVVLEFTQYSPGSRWRQVIIDRKEHREVGNEADGFYGGIRRLEKEEEISKWKSLWPDITLA